MLEFLQIERLFADGNHNAFTDLMYWNGQYYLCFRTARSHGVNSPGDIVIYRSPDLTGWELCAHMDTGGDDRDAKLIDAGTGSGWFSVPGFRDGVTAPGASSTSRMT